MAEPASQTHVSTDYSYPSVSAPPSSVANEGLTPLGGRTVGPLRVEVILVIVLRVLQMVFALIAFSVMSSLNSCQAVSINIPAFAYLIGAMVIQFVWSFSMLIIEILDALGKVTIFKDKNFLLIRFVGEFVVSYMSISGASAAAGVTTTFNSISGGAVCDGCASFCSYSRASTAFAFFAWATELPSFVIASFVLFQFV